jgi:hypothetical protein
MTGEPLPISLHFNPKPGIEPHHIPVVGAVTPDPKSLERTCGSGGFLDYLDSKVISQGGCLTIRHRPNDDLEIGGEVGFGSV